MKNILLVDDDREVSQSLANLFDTERFRFSFLEDGIQVTNYVSEHSDVDLVMLDVNLPTLSGLEVLKQIVREEQADLLVLGHEERSFFEKALFKGNVEDHVEELMQVTGAEVAVITDDVPMGTTAEQAGSHIRLLMLANDVSLRNLIPAELAKGFGFFQSKPATTFSPVAVTPDELGAAWDGRRVQRPLLVRWNGEQVGAADAGLDMVFDFPQLIAHLAKTRNARAGSIVGSGTVSNKDPAKGFSCIAEKRALEMIADGKPSTPFMRFGDTVRIEMFDRDSGSIFGAIEQTVQAPARRRG